MWHKAGTKFRVLLLQVFNVYAVWGSSPLGSASFLVNGSMQIENQSRSGLFGTISLIYNIFVDVEQLLELPEV